MRGWLWDTPFARVRGPEALAWLPAAERQAWQKLWVDVADTLARAGEQPLWDRGPAARSNDLSDKCLGGR
jgi:hypothetical protein